MTEPTATPPRLGKVLIGKHYRDAVHIAITPVIAVESLRKGEIIGFVQADTIHVGHSKNPIGIVDPFLTNPVRKGDQFWMFLFPNTITSLRHDWTHPAFPDPIVMDEQMAQIVNEHTKKVNESDTWMAEYADCLDISPKALIQATIDFLEGSNYLSDGGKFQSESLPDGFWEHFQNITGRHVPESSRHDFFSCSC